MRQLMSTLMLAGSTMACSFKADIHDRFDLNNVTPAQLQAEMSRSQSCVPHTGNGSPAAKSRGIMYCMPFEGNVFRMVGENDFQRWYTDVGVFQDRVRHSLFLGDGTKIHMMAVPEGL